MERAEGRAGTEGSSEEKLVVVDDDAGAMVVAGAAAAVPRSQGFGGDAIAVLAAHRCRPRMRENFISSDSADMNPGPEISRCVKL